MMCLKASSSVRRTSPSRVSLLLGTEPIWAAIVGIAIARDAVGPAGYVGIALILAGTAWGRSIEQRHRAAATGALGAPTGRRPEEKRFAAR